MTILKPLNEDEIDLFETLNGQAQSFYDEVQFLAKKSPHDTINPFKLNLINKALLRLNIFFDKFVPLEGFTHFDYASLPSNSDVAFVLSQYLAALEKIRADNVTEDGFGSKDWHWKSVPSRPTARPKKMG
jgi:hypothetical protein